MLTQYSYNYTTNLRLGCNPVGHELITHFLTSVTQLGLNILYRKQDEERMSGKGHRE